MLFQVLFLILCCPLTGLRDRRYTWMVSPPPAAKTARVENETKAVGLGLYNAVVDYNRAYPVITHR